MTLKWTWLLWAVAGCGPAVVGGPVPEGETDAAEDDQTSAGDDAAAEDGNGSRGGDGSGNASNGMDGEDDGPVSAGDEETSSGMDDGSTGEDVPRPPDCPALCETLHPGSCYHVAGQPEGALCVIDCEQVLPGQSAAAQAAFAECVATNPLCFELLTDCMFRTLYPDSVDASVRYVGTGYQAYEGFTVHADVRSDTVSVSVQATIVDGQFEIDIIVPIVGGSHPDLTFFVDTDFDTVCTDPDLAHATALDWTGDFDEPAFERTEPAPPSASDLDCAALN